MQIDCVRSRVGDVTGLMETPWQQVVQRVPRNKERVEVQQPMLTKKQFNNKTFSLTWQLNHSSLHYAQSPITVYTDFRLESRPNTDF
jgi:hypothetical protein